MQTSRLLGERRLSRGSIILLLCNCSLSSGWDTAPSAGALHPRRASPQHTGGSGAPCGGRQGREVLRGCLLPFQVPTAGEDDAACLPEQEWGGLDSRQQELYRMAVKGSYEAVVSLGKHQSPCTCRRLYLSSSRRHLASSCVLTSVFWTFGEQVASGGALTPLGFGCGWRVCCTLSLWQFSAPRRCHALLTQSPAVPSISEHCQDGALRQPRGQEPCRRSGHPLHRACWAGSRAPRAARGAAPAVSCVLLSSTGVPQDMAVHAGRWRYLLRAALSSSTNYFLAENNELL